MTESARPSEGSTSQVSAAGRCSVHGLNAYTGCPECLALAFAEYGDESQRLAAETFIAGSETWPKD